MVIYLWEAHVNLQNLQTNLLSTKFGIDIVLTNFFQFGDMELYKAFQVHLEHICKIANYYKVAP